MRQPIVCTRQASASDGHPAACDGACADFVVKNGRALYHNFPADPNTCARPAARAASPPASLRMQYPETAMIDTSADARGRITVKTLAEQALMRVAGRLTAEVLDLVANRIQPGVT